MNNKKTTKKNELTLEERLLRLQKTKCKKEKKCAEITSQIASAQKKSKNTKIIEEKICNRKRIQKELESIKREISTIRKEMFLKQDSCLDEGHRSVIIYRRETSMGTVEVRRCEVCGVVESELIKNTIENSPRLTDKPSFKQAE